MRTSTQDAGVHNRSPTIADYRQNRSSSSSLALESQNDRNDRHDYQRRMLPNSAIDNAFVDRAWSQPGNLEDDDFFSVLNDDAVMGDLNASTFGTWSTGADKTMEDALQRQAIEQPSDNRRNLADFNNADIPVTSADSRMGGHRQRSDLMSHTGIDKRQMNGHASSPSRPAAQSLVPASGRLGDLPSAQHPPALMQKLMQTGSLMYELQSIYSPEEHGGRSANIASDAFPIELAGKVLQVASDFLKNLRSFFSDDVSSSSSSSSSDLRRRRPSMLDFGGAENNTYHRAAGPFSHAISRPSSVYTSSSSSHAPTEWSSRRLMSAAKPTTLQLIANYMSLLQLYLLLYNAVYDYTRFTESDFRQSQPIWQDLSIGDAPLYQFVDIQIKMVLQVAARLLEDIEATLGLPENCRVSKKSVVEGSGILGMNVTAHFIEMCMSEVTTAPEPGRGTVARLRDIMSSLTNMLDGPICC